MRVALILAAHGSHHEAAVNRDFEALAQRLYAAVPFDQVLVAFRQGHPSFAEVLSLVAPDTQCVAVLPCMASAGYFCTTVLPQELAKNDRYANLDVFQLAPLGTHHTLHEMVSLRARALLDDAGWDAHDVSILVVGHGTNRHSHSRDTTDQLAGLLRERQVAAEVVCAFLDDEPRIESAMNTLRLQRVLVVPFLIGAGQHALLDVPRRIGLDHRDMVAPPFRGIVGKREILCDESVSSQPEMFAVLQQISRNALDQTVARFSHRKSHNEVPRTHRHYRLGTRNSALALWQAHYVAYRLNAVSKTVSIAAISTSGDRSLNSAIADLPSASPFTDDLDTALLSGDIDLAVHSYKDLPTTLPAGLIIAAVLPRADASESLVSRNGILLAHLTTGATVGTSSPRRAAQLLSIRPDVKPVTMRGPVNDRVKQVLAGRFDAALLATAGLQRLGLQAAIAETFTFEQMLPAPAQAAMVIVTRADHHELIDLLATWHDEVTHMTTTAELELFRRFESRSDLVVATLAEKTTTLDLRARLLSPCGDRRVDTKVSGHDPIALAAVTAEKLLAAWSKSERETAA